MLIYDAQGKRVRAVTLPEGAEITPKSTDSAAGATNNSVENAAGASSRDEKDDDDDDDEDDDDGGGERKGGEGKEAGGGGRGRGKGRVIFVDWYDGAEGLLHPQVPTLCIALDGGFVQLSRGVDDDSAPLVVNANMSIRQVQHKRINKSGKRRASS